jgi:UDP-N-acetylmuramoyl-tripeptide--D-alanyl-D-alanine ligase
LNWLWTTEDLVAAMGGRPVGAVPQGISGISIDSRSVTPGDAFFAIKGDRVDGHDYASIAAANGASVLIVSEGRLPALGRVIAPLIVVDDVLEALVKLGIAARSRVKGKVIAVTGSVGKTTTKEMLRHVLSSCGQVHASVASFNNHWGVPLTLARLPKDTDYGIFEIGMNHADEIRPLVKMVEPHVAIITTVAAAHLGNFRDLEEIAAAKAEIMEGLAPDGHVLLNRNNDQFDFLEQTAQRLGVPHIHGFGSNARSEFRLAEFNGTGETSLMWVNIGGRTYEVTIGAPGRHIAENALAVLGAAYLVGADMDSCVEALASLQPEKGRGQRHMLELGDGSSFTLIDESYNANPASMRAAIALLQAANPRGEGRRIAVLGDMLEMGEFSAKVHMELAEPLREAGITHVWLAGPEMDALRQALGPDMQVEYFPTATELGAFMPCAIRSNDVLMLKSSNGTGFGKIVTLLLDKFAAVSNRDS